MKSIVKRLTATMLCLLIISQGIYAKEINLDNDSDSSMLKLNEATAKARNKLKISKDFKLEHSRLRVDDQYLKLVWSLIFKTETSNIEVKVDAQTGAVLVFNTWDKNDGDVLKYTKEQVRKVAKEYIQENYEDIENQIEEIEVSELLNQRFIPHNRDNYTFVYARKLHNELFTNNYISITVSGVTGKLTGFKLIWDNCNYTKKSSEISEKEARVIFEKQDALKLKYISVNKNEDKRNKLTLKPVYYCDIENSGLLDSITKRFYEAEDVYSYLYPDLYNGKEKCCYDYDSGTQEIIPEEGVISKEKAEKLVLEKVSELINKKLKIKYSFYQKWYNGIEGKYWALTFSTVDKDNNLYVNSVLDATTGKILNISYINYDYKLADSNDATVDLKSLQKQGEDIIVKMFPSIEKDNYKIEAREDEGNKKIIHVKGTRMINGIKYEDNGFSFEYNTISKQITRFNFDWFYNIDIEDGTIKLTKKQVSKLFYDEVGIKKELIQLIDKNKEQKEKVIVPLENLALVYKLNPYKFAYIDVKDGKLLNYIGDEYKDDEVEYFTDIKGNKYEQQIELMNKMGLLKITSNKFLPTNKLTKKDAIKWIVLTLSKQYNYIPDVYRYNYPRNEIHFKDINKDDEYYNYINDAVNMNIIEDGNYFNKDKKVTLLDLSKWIINGMGQKDLAKYTTIFNEIEGVSNVDKGYISLSKYYRLINNTTKINEEKTRGETVDLLYNFISHLETSNKR
ncbi:MAG: hypothetical protein N4A63_07785 [Vallitalea sp.]|jgi:hypothetical protein|nr:hypothetical protein [Vallitalea sp.]